MQKRLRLTKQIAISLLMSSVLFFSGDIIAVNGSSQATNQQQHVSNAFSGQHAKFVSSVLDSTAKTNQQILSERQKLLALQTQSQTGKTLGSSDKKWLNNLADEYKIKSVNFSSKATWQEFDKRVDIVPASLVLAQAIQESGWGTSHIARHANNYFGQECFSHGCGMGAGHHSRGGYYEMARYDDIDEAINTYIHNLNSNKAYKKMWDIRSQERSHNGKINSIELVNGLSAYSELRGHYISAIKSVVNHLHLQQFDQLL